MNPLRKEMAKRMGLNLRQIRFMLPMEIENALLEGIVDKKMLDERFKFCVAISENDATKVHVRKEAEKY